jgi:hypothetical protein
MDCAQLDVFLSLFEIPEDARELLRAKNVMWIDVTNKEQSRISNDLGDEVSNFLKRFGVRTLRYPRMQHESSVAGVKHESQQYVG